jgi:hypothetical protein
MQSIAMRTTFPARNDAFEGVFRLRSRQTVSEEILVNKCVPDQHIGLVGRRMITLPESDASADKIIKD